MKFFRKTIICILLCVFTFSLAACGATSIPTPSSSDAVIGNGGTSVTKGNYLYFTNGYQSYSVITTSNRKDYDYVMGGLYVVELDDDGNIAYDDDDNIENIYQLSGRLVGYEYSNLYIFDNYLYYTTASTLLDKDGNLTSDRLAIYRMNLDGKNNELIYTSTSAASEVQYEYYYNDGNVFIVLFDNSNLYTIKCNSKIGSTTTLLKNVTSVAFEYIANYSEQQSNVANIYATTNYDENEDALTKGNAVVKINASTKETVFYYDNLRTYSLDNITNSKMYCYITDELSTTLYYSISVGKTINYANFSKLTTITSYSSIYIADNIDETGIDAILAVTSTGAISMIKTGSTQTLSELGTSSTILGIQSSMIYYLQDSSIKRMNLATYTVDVLSNIEDGTINTEASIDIASRYIYYYVDISTDDITGTYMYRIDTYSKNSEGIYSNEFVGTYQ